LIHSVKQVRKNPAKALAGLAVIPDLEPALLIFRPAMF
jgi:hypothetical protein